MWNELDDFTKTNLVGSTEMNLNLCIFDEICQNVNEVFRVVFFPVLIIPPGAGVFRLEITFHLIYKPHNHKSIVVIATDKFCDNPPL